MGFWCQLRPPKLAKSLIYRLLFNTFCKIGLSMLLSIFDSILVPTWLHVPSENQSKLHLNWNLEGIDLLIDFCMVFVLRFSFDLGRRLGAMLAPKTSPRRLQATSKTAPKTKCATLLAPAVILLDVWSSFIRC